MSNNHLIKKYGVVASKRFGQNFLVDDSIVKNIIEASEIEGKDVIEIGPGLGHLSIPLLKKANNVTSYEIDKNMIKILKKEIKNYNFILKEEDFLTADLSWIKTGILVANIPYNITSKILFKIFKNSNLFSHAVIMMQKEVGERILAKIDGKNYGKLTVTSNFFADISKVCLVPSSSFVPQPKVDSIVLRFDFKNADYEKNKNFIDFIKSSFSFRRKLIKNNLNNLYETEKINRALNKMNVKEKVRPQELSLEQYLELFSYLKD